LNSIHLTTPLERIFGTKDLWGRLEAFTNFGEAAVKVWMELPRHRKNIINPQFTKIGEGVYQ